MEVPVVGSFSFTAPDDDAVWVFTPGPRVWSTDDDRYLFDEDFRAIYPDAPQLSRG
jgi:hypothetical protein